MSTPTHSLDDARALGPIVVHISGGKDSTALLIHALERGVSNLRAVFCDTGHELPKTIEYVASLSERTGVSIQTIKADFSGKIARKRMIVSEKWAAAGVSDEIIARALAVLVPTGNPFLDLCIAKGIFPRRLQRFCTDELKVIPFERQVLQPLLSSGCRPVSWVGVRADESRSRSKLPLSEWTDPGYWLERPILAWSVDDVWAAHRRADIEPNPLYREGMRRVGCAPCIMAGKDELAEISARYPEEIERVRQWEEIVAQANKEPGAATFFHQAMQGGRIDDVARWAMTARGGKQYDLLKWANKHSDSERACSSQYGLCE